MRRAARRLTSARAFHLAAMLTVATLAGCRGDAPTSNAEARAVPITISASLTADQRQLIAAMTVEVSGPAIAVPIVAELDVAATSVNGSVTVPVGGNRRFVVHAYDGMGLESYTGEATTTVRPGSNAPLAITLYARSGGVPVVVTVGTIAISLDVVGAALGVGGTTTVTATITDAGTVVSTGTVRWAALNPVVLRAVAGADGRGVQLTGLVAGSTTLVASYEGVAGAMPVTVTSGAQVGFREIYAGPHYTCALDGAGAAWCWGLNIGGLGEDSTAGFYSHPVPLSGGLHFLSLALGIDHACGVTTAGEAWCWGQQWAGQLGNGITSATVARTPQRVLGFQTWRAIWAIWEATCGATTTGELWCWGSASPDAPPLAPSWNITSIPVLRPGAGSWSELTMTQSASCALSAAGSATCTVADDQNLVNSGSAGGYTWRTLQVSDQEWLTNGVDVGWRATAAFACGLTTTHDIRCWGWAVYGQLGRVTEDLYADSPTLVEGPQGYDALAVGGMNACGIRSNAAYCWGSNLLGQLGDGTTTDRDTPTAVVGNHAFTRLAAGGSHTCGLRGDGVVLCWGYNGSGQLGDGTTTSRLVPVAVLRDAGVQP